MQDKVFCNEISIRAVAEELGMPVALVKEIIGIQSEYTAKVMSDGSFDSIRYVYLGTLKSKPKEVQMINHLKGMTPEQQTDFKIAVKTRRIILNHWEKKPKLNKEDES